MELEKSAGRHGVTLTKEILNLFADHHVYFSSDGLNRRLRLGTKLFFSESCEIEPHVGFYAGDCVCTIGTMSYLAATSRKYATEVEVGRYSSLGPFEIPGPRHPIEAVTTSVIGYNRSHTFAKSALKRGDDDSLEYAERSIVKTTRKGPVIIGHDVWFGGYITVNPGLTVGNGSVVAANSVVTKNIPPFEIWGGNPARLIKPRFPAHIVEALTALQWWDYAPTDIAQFPLADPEVFIKEFEPAVKHLEKYTPKKLNLFESLSKQS
ncbi:CatB-related O-acetyltransferase [Methylobacillus flagellatus]|uniref:CatB-related O-acetyltransferase n=1 Tax=Methylobacillus flagellatus TaxID=405 RepID=UPI0010F7D82C|nr:CatB-related O-acetyltransferase [Methylobacillus flagellatus]